MINLTKNIIVKKTGIALEKAIVQSVKDTRRILFNTYSEGKVVLSEEIISTSQRKPPTFRLGFCKFFDENSILKIETPWDEFIQKCYEIYLLSANQTPKSKYAEIIPSYKKVEGQLPVTFLNSIKKGLGIMLMSLWHQDAIILTPFFRMPISLDGSRGKKVMICEPLYSEILAFFQEFRQTYDDNAKKLSTSEGLSESLQNNIQGSGWRIIIATDWHSVEDVSVVEAAKILKAMADHKSGKNDFISIPAPLREMLSMIKGKFGKRANYTMTDFLEAREAVFNKITKTEIYSPYGLNDGLGIGDIADLNLKKLSKEWVKTELSYIKSLKKSGMKSYNAYVQTLTILNEYLFYYLPSKKRENEAIKIPIEPKELTRKYIDEVDDVPSMIDFFEKNRKQTTVAGHLYRLDQYFDYLEAISPDFKSLKGFKNPIFRKVDFPKGKRRRGTTKNIISQIQFSTLLSYLYAIEQFMWYVSESLVSDDLLCERRIHVKQAMDCIPKDYESYIEVEKFGFVPFVNYKGKNYPIKTIHKSIFSIVNRKIKNSGFVKMPNMTHLYQTIIGFETGIRNIHVRWLDSRTYDKHIDRERDLPPLCELEVNTDKVKRESWKSFVSSRVIVLLDKLKYLSTKYDEPWKNETYWYDDHEDSPFGKITSIFSSGGQKKNGGKPCTDGTQIEKFKQILIGFQNFSNMNNLFDEPLEYASVEVYKDSKGHLERKFHSEITLHSARATVVSHHIKILPTYIIGKYITGHESEAVVAYYAVVDREYLNLIGKGQELAVDGQHPYLNDLNDAIAIKAEDLHSKLRKAIDLKMNEAFADFGATSFEREKSNGDLESGISIAKEVNTDQLAHNSTHICPYNNHCPDDVVKEVGRKQCGQCWASIKTVDHLPRITAHIRDLHAKVEEKMVMVKLLISNQASDSVLEQREEERHQLANEESAWIATHAILENFRKDASLRDNYLISKPEIIEKHVSMIATNDSPLTNILHRIQDAKNYPEYFSPQLQAGITKLRNKILAQMGDIEQLVNQPDDYELLDEFRGIIRGVCDATDTTLEELAKVMDSELPVGNKKLQGLL